MTPQRKTEMHDAALKLAQQLSYGPGETILVRVDRIRFDERGSVASIEYTSASCPDARP